MTTTIHTRFAEELSAAQTPQAAYEALFRFSDALMPVRLWTVMDVDRTACLARRAFTNMPEAYPVSGTKPIPQNDWAAQVLEQRKYFVANTLEGIAKVFPDHALIGELGCGSVMNLPIVQADEVIGSVNLLDAAHHFTADRIRAVETFLTDPARDAMMRARTLDDG
jgi:GAF domain-containing protein